MEHDCGYINTPTKRGRYTVLVYPSGYCELGFVNFISGETELISKGYDKDELIEKGWQLSKQQGR